MGVFMRSLGIVAFTAGCFALWPRPADSAVPYSTREILPSCQVYVSTAGNNQNPLAWACRWSIATTSDAASQLHIACPKGVPYFQQARVVVQYAQAYTAHVDQSFATTILDALRATYPCH
jgi:hypothetical protein